MHDFRQLEASANADSEFRLAARFWSTQIALRDGSAAQLVRIEDGCVVEVRPCEQDTPCDVSISASREEWERFLEPIPRPFYQDLWGAWTRHGFELEGDLDSLYPYYPALRRLFDLVRSDG